MSQLNNISINQKTGLPWGLVLGPGLRLGKQKQCSEITRPLLTQQQEAGAAQRGFFLKADCVRDAGSDSQSDSLEDVSLCWLWHLRKKPVLTLTTASKKEAKAPSLRCKHTEMALLQRSAGFPLAPEMLGSNTGTWAGRLASLPGGSP